MAKEKEPTLYEYAPANPGESLVSHGIPARDLTKRDWDRLEPAQRRQALAKGPSGEPMYRKAAAPKAAEPPKTEKPEKPAGGEA